MKISSRKIPSSVIYLFLFLIFLIFPLINNNYSFKDDFTRILYDWLRMLPFVLVFFLNNYWFLPRFLYKGNSNRYALVLISSIFIISAVFVEINPILHKNDPKLIEQRILQDPQWGREDMRPGKSMDAPSSLEILKENPLQSLKIRRIPEPDESIFQLINTMLISLLIAGFNTAISVTNRWFTEEQARKEIEKEHMKSELNFLQNQVSPHFFMNTLNNIHALIEADHELAQNAVLKLSEMMRYLLYESGRGTTTLAREIEFLKSYIKLMQLRVSDSVIIETDFPDEFVNYNLPPLLFISFIENAFKHGVSYLEPSRLSFQLIQYTEYLEFSSVNTISVYNSNKANNQHKGVGMENIKKRLNLLYGNRYQLIIDNSSHEFNVRLLIPMI